MFLPPRTSFGLAVEPMPVTWGPSDWSRGGRHAAHRAQEDELARYFPEGWNRDTAADWPAAPRRPTAAPLSSKLVEALAAFCPRLWQRAFLRRQHLDEAPSSRA